MKKLLFFVFLSSLAIGLFAQSKQDTSKNRKIALTSTFAGNDNVAHAKPKAYTTLITAKAITHNGLFKIHKVDDHYYFELGDSVLNREILVVSRIARAGAEVREYFGYAGDAIGNCVITFEKGPDNRIFMRKKSYRTYSQDSTSAMYTSVQRSNVQAIVATFNIAAISPEGKGSVIDITDYINGDNNIFFFSISGVKQRFRLGSLLADRSYISDVRSFKNNIEIGTVKTYTLTEILTGGFGSNPGSATVELNTSLVMLPKVPMKARYFDPRVGYFSTGYIDFDLNPQGIKNVSMIARWRLEVKPEDMAKYERGELVEPKKQIVYYIDPATPKKWVPYLIAGVNDWQKAFEKAGFKNAIVARVAPTAKEDSTWSLDDASHSVIVYKPSEAQDASGPHVSDPRSGEILETHINWYHNVMKLVHDWYMIQTAAVDPRARKMEFDDELMGELIRFVSSHEVGHTLGLCHNYGSSSTVPVEKLRDKKWVEANGHTPSIMDYARFNYVAQPEDHISYKGLYPRIGDYDKWAIEWGYKVFDGDEGPEWEKSKLNNMLIAAMKNRRLWYGPESNRDDPRSQSEDLGDNAMKASDYGIKNLKRILPKLPEWTRQPNEGYNALNGIYGQLIAQFSLYMGHVIKNIGGIYENPKVVEQPGPIYQVTPAATQKEAMDFLNRQLFTTPTWLADTVILNRVNSNGIQIIYSLQDAALRRLVNTHTMNKLLVAESQNPKNYKITDFFGDLQNDLFSELKDKRKINIYRRNLQKLYVDRLINIISPPASAGGGEDFSELKQTDVVSVCKGELIRINHELKNALPGAKNSMTKYHLMDLSNRITTVMNRKEG
ncbi:MAG: hypothetical protein JWR50_711 [Mucilaginibacter sp.]|nr:hypothetical protein [Mucilaginibacter sp.]